jgi:hypothetical protein
MSWDAQSEKRLRQLADDGLSSGKIAAIMDRSRSAIVAKCSRLPGVRLKGNDIELPRLPLRSSAPHVLPEPKACATVKAKPQATPLVALSVDAGPAGKDAPAIPNSDAVPPAKEVSSSQPIAGSNPVTFFQLEKCMCRWPLARSDDDEQLYCGARSHFRASFCDEHADLGTQPKYRRPRGRYGERLPVGVTSTTLRIARSHA